MVTVRTLEDLTKSSREEDVKLRILLWELSELQQLSPDEHLYVNVCRSVSEGYQLQCTSWAIFFSIHVYCKLTNAPPSTSICEPLM